MARRITALSSLAATTALLMTGGVMAGGLEANGYNWDHLFDAAPFAARGTVTHVMIDQPIQGPSGATVATSADRNYYNFGFKADLGDASSCLISVQNPWGSGTDRSLVYAAVTGQAARERVFSNDVGLTCAYGFGVGPGVLSVIGGVSAQSLDYEATLPLPVLPPPAIATGVVDLSGSGLGWRAGLAYEVPEIALRVSAIYNAAVDYDLSGTLSPFGRPITASATMPQSFEVKGQTGIAPGWLALGSVKWVDWSVLQTLSVQGAGLPISTNLSYEDGWTVSAGVGHTLTEDLTVLGSLTWDKGTSRENGAGVLLAGTQTDRWGASLGAAYKVSDNLELSGGLSYSILESGRNARGETWDTGSVFAISAGLKASF